MKHIQSILERIENGMSSCVSILTRADVLNKKLQIEKDNLKNHDTIRVSNSTNDIKEEKNKRELTVELEVAIAILNNFIENGEFENVFMDNLPKGINKTTIDQICNAIERIVNPDSLNDPNIFLDL